MSSEKGGDRCHLIGHFTSKIWLFLCIFKGWRIAQFACEYSPNQILYFKLVNRAKGVSLRRFSGRLSLFGGKYSPEKFKN